MPALEGRDGRGDEPFSALQLVRIRANQHGHLAIRLRFDGRQSHEGTKLKDTPENRLRVEERARVIDRKIRDGTFEYLHWFPDGNLAAVFRKEEVRASIAKRTTVRTFFSERADPKGSVGTAVSKKWRSNRASAVKENVLPHLGRLCLDELRPAHLVELQRTLLAKPLARNTVDGIVQNALRSMLRAARVSGYRVPELRELYAKDFLRRLAAGSHEAVIDPYSPAERESLLAYFRRERRPCYAFVFFRFWTGTRPGEAIALRRSDVDLQRRIARIRRSRVLGQDAETKTRKSRRDVVLNGHVVDLLHDTVSCFPPS